ncbi:hypothetical protein [Pontibacter sp. G13]|uniref:hypothetical protein n=1 Tax=Pontibacter sp. G13 TaxID=3074898 RepID=UPI002889BA42|nr:hypothetical protein [Pontibacter sp. G13]WNJ17052.1 hypothetical protein RJD25_19530 [Pontibacter sp. G13]
MRILAFILMLTFWGCSSQSSLVLDYTSGPPAIVYKTKQDYSQLVPVLLSADKSQIVSYPHPKDLKVGGKYLVPTSLSKGYWLDNKGIMGEVAFLGMTYAEYAALPEAPSLADLYDAIVDKDPMMEVCDCGSRKAFSDIEQQLNRLIDKRKLRTKCKAIL